MTTIADAPVGSLWEDANHGPAIRAKVIGFTGAGRVQLKVVKSDAASVRRGKRYALPFEMLRIGWRRVK